MPSRLRALKSFGLESDTHSFELQPLPVSYSDFQEVTCLRFLNYNKGMLIPHAYLFFWWWRVQITWDFACKVLRTHFDATEGQILFLRLLFSDSCFYAAPCPIFRRGIPERFFQAFSVSTWGYNPQPGRGSLWCLIIYFWWLLKKGGRQFGEEQTHNRGRENRSSIREVKWPAWDPPAFQWWRRDM